MQKAKLLKGTGILLSEDFPKRIKEKRSQLLKFAKEVSTSSTIFKIFCFYIIHIILLILFILCSVHIFLFLLFLYSIYHKLLQSLKLKTEYGNETQFRKPSFMIVVWQFWIYQYFCQELLFNGFTANANAYTPK